MFLNFFQKNPGPYWIRLRIGPKMLDPDPYPYQMNKDPKPWSYYCVQYGKSWYIDNKFSSKLSHSTSENLTFSCLAACPFTGREMDDFHSDQKQVIISITIDTPVLYQSTGSIYSLSDEPLWSYKIRWPFTWFPWVLRIRDVYPESRILIFTPSGSRISDPGSRIPDPKTATKDGWKKICCQTFFCSHKFHKIENYLIF